MDFLGMGTGEILLIIIAALIIWGPGRIVEIARTLGKMVRSLRNITSDLTTAVTREIDLAEKEPPSLPSASSNHPNKESPDAGTTKASNPETTHHSHDKGNDNSGSPLVSQPLCFDNTQPGEEGYQHRHFKDESDYQQQPGHD